jgi:glycosyltransferase involved in cell wall biosynthesis
MKGVVIVPACNERGSLRVFLPRLKRNVAKLSLPHEMQIVVVDDGSTDDTVEVAAQAGCRILKNGENRGLGISLRRGYELAVMENFDFLVTMDSDGQHRPELLRVVLDKFFAGFDLVLASRYHPMSERFGTPLDRDLLNIAFTSMIRAMTGWQNLSDPLTGFWTMRIWVAKFLYEQLKLERYGTCLEALIKLWWLATPRPSITEVPHPAIYENDGTDQLNRTYSPSNKEVRLERFGTHAVHLLAALEDVRRAGFGEEIDEVIKRWRERRE